MSGGGDDEWVNEALTQDLLVAELLVRLKRRSLQLRLDWGLRQRRSKPAAETVRRMPVESKEQEEIAKDEASMASPATPLSWRRNGASSSSSSAAAVCGPDLPPRSKVAASLEATPGKRSRKKRTLTELKEDESLLLKERKCLKHELASLRVILEERKAMNESLKKMKIDLLSVAKFSDQTWQRNAVCDASTPILSITVPCKDLDASFASLANGSSNVQKGVGTLFELPDLNLPLEDGSS